MALSPPQPLNGQRVLRISGSSDSANTGSADSAGSMASAQKHGQTNRLLESKNQRVVKQKIRVVTWNIGTLTGKSRELAEVLKKRRVHVACIQETKWKGSKAREIGEGYKLFYHGTTAQRNGVGIVLNEELKTKVVEVKRVIEVKRVSDRLMVVKLALDCGSVHVISAYAPQVGCTESEKEEFQQLFDHTLQNIAGDEKVIVGADLNGHVGANREGYERHLGGQGYGS